MEIIKYIYNMKYRPLDFNCQPKGWIEYRPDASRHGHVVYSRKLTDEEVHDYELEFIREEKCV